MGRTLPSLLEIADPDDIREKLDAVRATAKDELALKRGVVSVLKQALTEGREKARERLEQGAESRPAPVTIPDRHLEAGEGEEMDAAAQRLLERRDALNEEAESDEADGPSPDASDFVSEGQDRTPPPQGT